MTGPTPIRLTWHGQETVSTAREALIEERPVELHLAQDFHHAIFARLAERQPAAGAERVDRSGGSEILVKLAEIRGLSGLACLAETVHERGAQVHIISPAPILYLVPAAHETGVGHGPQ